MARFQDVIGQDQIKEHLQNAIISGKVSHAYLIDGEKASGKEFIGKLYAMALQCEEREEGSSDPCGICHSCRQALSGNQPDIITLTHEKPGVIGVEDIRTQINQDVYIMPYSSPYKIYLINEAEKMTPQAQNALLKTLEEPPGYVVILLLTSNVNTLLPTIISRSVVLHMRPVQEKLVKQYLMEKLQVPDYKAEVCAAFARGNIGRAKALASSEDFDNVKTEVLSMLKNVREMEIEEITAAIKHISDYKADVNDYLDLMAIWYRDVLLYKATNDANQLIFREEWSGIRACAARSSYEGIETVLEALEKAKKRLNANVNFDLTMELLLLTVKEYG
jgi:DNA polymerase-3 subunit delta'